MSNANSSANTSAPKNPKGRPKVVQPFAVMTGKRGEGKVKEVLMDPANVAKVIDYFANSSSAMLAKQCAYDLDMRVESVNMILATQNARMVVQSGKVALPAGRSGFDPNWTYHVANPAMLPSATPGTLMEVPQASSKLVTTVLRENFETKVSIVASALSTSRRSPKYQKAELTRLATLFTEEAETTQGIMSENLSLRETEEDMREKHGNLKQEHETLKKTYDDLDAAYKEIMAKANAQPQPEA